MTSEITWYDNRNNLVELWSFLTEVGLEPEMPDFLDKPYDYDTEFKIMEENPDWNNYSSEQLDELAVRISDESE